MSSSKMRMRVRQHRLQEIYKSLGKEPNSKEIEVKAMISDFDKVGRKQLTRLRKAKNERLPQRANNLKTYGLRSRERTTIDEEFVSQLKLVEADMKRMAGILVSYEEQKPDLKKHEKDERLAVIKCLKEALRILKDDFEQQTRSFEMGGGYRQVYSGYQEDPMNTQMTDTSNMGLSANATQNKYLINEGRGNSPNQNNIPLSNKAKTNDLSGIAEQQNQQKTMEWNKNSFEANVFAAQKTLEALEKQHLALDGDLDEGVQWHLGDQMTHSYYLDTVTNIRSFKKCSADLVMVILILCFIMSGLSLLRQKNYIDNFHETWKRDDQI